MRAGEKKAAAAAAAESINNTSCAATTRLKREECKRTRHDSAFSDWKILVGPSDWDDYEQGKDGAERYRTQNLPNHTSCPGIYELGVAILRLRSARRARKLNPDIIVPVYLGQAENVRNRLQQYGREGSHLEKVYVNTKYDSKYEFGEKEPGLFTDIFSRGFAIAYRWAPMDNKREAETTEARLLNKFDYAWNKDINGKRRYKDILNKVDRLSKASQLQLILKKIMFLPQKKLGIKIKVCEGATSKNLSGSSDKLEMKGLLTQVFKFGRSRPRSVSLNSGVEDDTITVCGVALGHGMICARSPVEGRKRCPEHKGMKVNGFTSKISAPPLPNDVVESGGDSQSAGHRKRHTHSGCIIKQEPVHICGYIMDSGCPCVNPPVQGNKRCLEHKGRRVHKSVSQSAMYIASCDDDDDDKRQILSNKSCRMQNTGEEGKVCKITCGVYLTDETFCTKTPVAGRKRCKEHKGMRVKRLTHLLITH